MAGEEKDNANKKNKASMAKRKVKGLHNGAFKEGERQQIASPLPTRAESDTWFSPGAHQIRSCVRLFGLAEALI
jgi:hypothetical protein